MKFKHTEADHQRALADWLDAIGVLWFHPPNGGFRHARVAAKLKAEGVDLAVLGWLVFVSHGHTPAIEWLKGLGYGGRRA